MHPTPPPREPSQPCEYSHANELYGVPRPKTLYALIYVIPFYLFAATRPSRTLRRDDPSVIAARIRSVSYSTTCCCAISYAILFLANDHVPPETSAAALPLRQMGLWPLGLSSTAYALALTALLFAGPLYESVIIDQECAVLIRDPAYPLRSLRTMTTFRNIIAVRPFPCSHEKPFILPTRLTDV